MIPKIIHYCWFGGKEKHDLAQFCIASWHNIHPDFQIIEWNEKNSPLEDNAYVKEAFAQGKWAFVSDYVRSKVIYEHGGIYMDTDMELKLPLTEFLREKALCSFVARNCDSSAPIGVSLRKSSRLVASSAVFAWRAHTLHALRVLASEAEIVLRPVCPLQMPSLR